MLNQFIILNYSQLARTII